MAWRRDSSQKNLNITQTDMCLALTRHRNAKRRASNSKLIALPNPQLHLAYIEIKFSPFLAERELAGVHKFCENTTGNPNLEFVRLALISNATASGAVGKDIIRNVPESDENAKIYQDQLKQWAKAQVFNPPQMNFLKQPQMVRDGIILAQSCPGTGKTSFVVEMVWQLTNISHKVMVTAPSNGTVDAFAKRMWSGLRSSKERKC